MHQGKKEVIIIGASIAGLAAAIVLEKYGINYRVYEKEGPERVGGAGITLAPSAKEILDAIGVPTAEFLDITNRQYFNSRDELLYDDPKFRYTTSWQNLFKKLLSTANLNKIHFHHKVISCLNIYSFEMNT